MKTRSQVCRGVSALVVLLVGASPLGAQSADSTAETAAAKDRPPAPAPPRVRFVMKERPSFRVGEAFRVDVRARIEADVRGYRPEIDSSEGAFDLYRRRVGVSGSLFKRIEFEVTRELGEARRPWRDAFVNLRLGRPFELQLGQFKVPFSREYLTGGGDLDFAFRSLAATHLAPGRNTGLMAHGRMFKRGLAYQAGVFRPDRDRVRAADPPLGRWTWAGRMTGTPFRQMPAPAVLRGIEVGLAASTSQLSEGLNGLGGNTVSSEIPFFEPVYVRGRRVRIGTEIEWAPGPVAVRAEYIRVRDDRQGQGLRGETLPDAIAEGWYLSGTWLVTGEPKVDGLEPRRTLFAGGPGAIELAGRVEELRFTSAAHPGRPFRNPRAANILGNADRVWTLGVNWYLNRWVTVRGNVIAEQIADTARSPIPGRARFWGGVVRVQFEM